MKLMMMLFGSENHLIDKDGKRTPATEKKKKVKKDDKNK